MRFDANYSISQLAISQYPRFCRWFFFCLHRLSAVHVAEADSYYKRILLLLFFLTATVAAVSYARSLILKWEHNLIKLQFFAVIFSRTYINNLTQSIARSLTQFISGIAIRNADFGFIDTYYNLTLIF